MSYAELKKLVNQKWPEVSFSGEERDDLIFSTGIKAFDSLFSHNGIPCGQLVEINGSVSSGKTSFLFKILSSFTQKQPVAYLDFSSSFFPSAAKSSGIDISKIFVVRADDFREGLRAAELILRNKIACYVASRDRAVPEQNRLLYCLRSCRYERKLTVDNDAQAPPADP